MKPIVRIQLPSPYATTVDMWKNRIAIAGTTKEINLYAPSVGIEEPLAAMKGHELGVSCVRFNTFRHELLLSGSLDGSVRMWDLTRKTQIRMFRDNSHSCTSCSKVAWANGNAGERTFLGAFEDASVKLFDGREKNADVIKVFTGHDSDVNSVTWSKDDTFFASASSDSTVCIWDVRKTDSSLKSLSTSRIKGDALDVAMIGDGKDTFVYVAYEESPFFAVWPMSNPADGDEDGEEGPDAKTTSSRTIPSNDDDGPSTRSRGRTGSYMSPALSKRVTCVEASPTGSHFVTGDWGSNIIVWDVAKCKQSDWHTTGFFDIE